MFGCAVPVLVLYFHNAVSWGEVKSKCDRNFAKNSKFVQKSSRSKWHTAM